MALKSLIVCADTKALQVLRQIFEDLGVGVEHCEHSSLATSRVATGSFDAIVIDAADPNGLQLMSTARHSSENHTSLIVVLVDAREQVRELLDRKSTRLNSSHVRISYAVFCLKKKKCDSAPS